MPSSRTATATDWGFAEATASPRPRAGSARTAPRPKPRQPGRTQQRTRQAPRRAPQRRVRWDRLGRIALLIVLLVVFGVIVQDGINYLSTRAQAAQQRAIVHRLSSENAQLLREQKALGDPATIVRDARALGMVRTGERPYVVTGLPQH